MEREGARAGWYADPWQVAPLRWWDGIQWTGHTTGPPPFRHATLEPEPTTPRSLASRFAVVDVETTGLYTADRVVEVAIVTLDGSGHVVDEFETLLNPNRDVGPTWLHRITPSMVAGAPLFDDVAGHVAARLDGSVVCAHNLPFDQRMLLAEFERCGVTVDWGEGLDTLAVTRAKLGDACAEAGIQVGDGHRALDDARACAQLLAAHQDRFEIVPVPAKVGPAAVRPIRIVTRDGHTRAAVDTPFLVELAAHIRVEPDVAPYVDLLDQALADLQLTTEERAGLTALADSLGLDAGSVRRAHRDFLNQLIDAAVEDHVVTADEYDQLCRAAALLDIDADVVNQRTDGLRSSTTAIDLAAVETVCFTGVPVDENGDEIDRGFLEMIATTTGITPVRSATKTGCGLLVAADPASRSGKAANARRYGIPICSATAFLTAVETGGPLEVTVVTSAGVALVCTGCGTSWLAGRRSTNPLCADCKAAATKNRPKKAGTNTNPETIAGSTDSTSIGGRGGLSESATEPSSDAATETLTCAECGGIWDRVVVRGRKPHRCPQCT